MREFERIAEAPNANESLRRFVLDLAVRGRLARQDPADEPASALIQRIAKKQGFKYRAGDSIVLGTDQSEMPFQLPANWAWVPATFPARLISEKGKKVQTKAVAASGAFPVVDQGKVLIRGYCNDETKVLRVETPIVLFGDHTREVKYIDFDFVVGADGVKLLEPVEILPQYYYLALRWTPLRARGYGRHFRLLRETSIPLPPLAEQQRIVAKTDELISLCDQLEAARSQREAKRDRLRLATLQRLTSPDSDGTTSAADARFFLDQSPRLITKPEHLEAVRQAIFDLAVRGRLVPQDPTDEPASEVLGRIPVRARNRRGSSRQLDENGATPFTVPIGWQWTQFHRLISGSDAGWSPKTEAFARDGDAWAVLKVSAVSWDAFQPRENKKLLPGVMPRPAAQVRSGDFLISRANTSELVAKAVVVLEAPPNLMLSDKIVRLDLVADCVPRYLLMTNNHADYARAYYAQKASGASPSMKNVSREVIYRLPIPLPPIAEQHRIVAKVDQLMAVCDELEVALASAQTERGRLLESLLPDALTAGSSGSHENVRAAKEMS
jgi:type I restriction enzyme, S subunit